MKVLYGVQGTGNGHISRAREMVKFLGQQGVDVTWLFTGRDRDKFFEMEDFGDFLHRRGLTFITRAGQVKYLDTVLHNNSLALIRDIRALDVSGYDLVISDFEPVSAWAGKLQNKPVLGLGHQYAFNHAIPIAGANLVATTIMRHFAPAGRSVGLHWHHFNQPILPPIIDHSLQRLPGNGSIVVYLPFEDQAAVTRCLRSIKGYHFLQYSPELDDSESDNVSLRATSHAGFKRDLSQADAVICNAGFELVSECLQLGLPLLVKPLNGQMEQLSNAAALQQLGYAQVFNRLEESALQAWVDARPEAPAVNYPDVAQCLAQWIAAGAEEPVDALRQRLWSSS